MQNIATKEVEAYKVQVNELVKQAYGFVIASKEENDKAMELKAKLKSTWKSIEEHKESITKPLNESLRNVRALFAPLEELYRNADRTIGMKLIVYKNQVDEEARKKEAQIAARVDRGTMRLDTAEKKVADLPQVQKTTHTAAGQVQFRKIKKVKIINKDLIPDEYWVLDEVAIRRDALAGKLTAGVEVYEEEIV